MSSEYLDKTCLISILRTRYSYLFYFFIKSLRKTKKVINPRTRQRIRNIGYATFQFSDQVIILRSDIPPIPAIKVSGMKIAFTNVNLVTDLLFLIPVKMLYADINESFFSVSVFMVLIILESFTFKLLK